MSTAAAHPLSQETFEPVRFRQRARPRSARWARLAEFSLLEGVDPEALAELESSSQARSLAKGRLVYLPGEAPEAIYFLTSGRVKVSRLSDAGKELILDIFEPGHFFGETELIDEQPRETLAEVLEPATLIAVPAARFRKVLRTDFVLTSRLTRILGRRQKQLEKRLLGVVTKSAPQRLAELLLELAKIYGVRDARGTLLRIKLSQSAIGNLLGVSREIVNHTFSDFKRRGVIEVTAGRVIIQDPTALSELAA